MKISQIFEACKPWIASLRPMESFGAGVLAIAGFRLVDMKIIWPAVVAVFIGTMATMVENDWHDRVADRQKGKYLASEHPIAFSLWRAGCWGACVPCIAAVFGSDPGMGALLVGLVIMSLMYTYVYNTPLLPGIFVAVASATPVLLPVAGGVSSPQSWLLFVAVVCITYAMEVLHDMHGRENDIGRKWTWATTLSDDDYWEQSLRIASFCGLLGAFALLGMMTFTMLTPWPWLVLVGALMLQTQENTRTGRRFLVAGLGLTVLTISRLVPF